MRLAPYFAGEYALIFERTLARFDRGAAFTEDHVALVPELLADDCRNGLAGFVLVDHPFFFRQETLLACTVIDDSDLVSAIASLILRIR